MKLYGTWFFLLFSVFYSTSAAHAGDLDAALNVAEELINKGGSLIADGNAVDGVPNHFFQEVNRVAKGAGEAAYLEITYLEGIKDETHGIWNIFERTDRIYQKTYSKLEQCTNTLISYSITAQQTLKSNYVGNALITVVKSGGGWAIKVAKKLGKPLLIASIFFQAKDLYASEEAVDLTAFVIANIAELSPTSIIYSVSYEEAKLVNEQTMNGWVDFVYGIVDIICKLSDPNLECSKAMKFKKYCDW